jgi:carbon monoxide dehydrogenase subunit G
MPSTSFRREIKVSSDRDRCWQTLTNVGHVAGWVSIVGEVRENEPLKSYNAVLEDRLGPFKVRADLDITVSDVEEGYRLHAYAEGEDRQVRSQIVVDGDLRLEADDGGMRIVVAGTYEVSGRVATLGSSMIQTKAQKILDEFFENVTRELS